jgi:hypothetical protein
MVWAEPVDPVVFLVVKTDEWHLRILQSISLLYLFPSGYTKNISYAPAM